MYIVELSSSTCKVPLTLYKLNKEEVLVVVRVIAGDGFGNEDGEAVIEIGRYYTLRYVHSNYLYIK